MRMSVVIFVAVYAVRGFYVSFHEFSTTLSENEGGGQCML